MSVEKIRCQYPVEGNPSGEFPVMRALLQYYPSRLAAFWWLTKVQPELWPNLVNSLDINVTNLENVQPAIEALSKKQTVIFAPYPHTRTVDGLVAMQAISHVVTQENKTRDSDIYIEAKLRIILSSKFDKNSPFNHEYLKSGSESISNAAAMYNVGLDYMIQPSLRDLLIEQSADPQRTEQDINSYMKDSYKRLRHIAKNEGLGLIMFPEATRNQTNDGVLPFVDISAYTRWTEPTLIVPVYLSGVDQLVSDDSRVVRSMNPHAEVVCNFLPAIEVTRENRKDFDLRAYVQDWHSKQPNNSLVFAESTNGYVL